MAQPATGKGAAHDPQVVTEDNVTEATLAPESVLWADLAGEAKVRLQRARSKVEKAKRDLKDATDEVARLEKEQQ